MSLPGLPLVVAITGATGVIYGVGDAARAEEIGPGDPPHPQRGRVHEPLDRDRLLA